MGNSEGLTQEEIDLRRRARRRLVGAIALALLAVVVVPMLFDPEPKPLGPGVDIRIPDPSTPFVPAAPDPGRSETQALVAPPAAVEQPAGTPPAGTRPEAGVDQPVGERPAETPRAEPTPAKAAVAEKPAVVDKPVAAVKAKPRPSDPPPAKAKPKPQEPAPDQPVPEAFQAKGYFLQLGAFSNEAYANALADKARKAGFKVVVQDAGGQSRVRVGPYRDRDEAVAVQGKLREKDFGSVLLGP